MTLIADTDHTINPKAIAEIIHQELHSLNLDQIAVDAEIVDSNLDLQIRTNSAIDREKLLTLIHSCLQSLQIESLAKYRIHCWRNSAIAESRLLWTEQFMLQPLEVPNPPLAKDTNSSRLPEPQLSKNSVLQSAIQQIANTTPKMQEHLSALQQAETRDRLSQTSTAGYDTDLSRQTKSPQDLSGRGNNDNAITASTIDHSYWHLVLVGLSIVLVGLGIGAVVRALTARNIAADMPTSPLPKVQETAIPQTPTPAVSIPVVVPEPNSIKPVVTLSKFNLIENGMTIEQVEQIFGVTGKVIAETNSGENVGKVYSWRNPEGSNAIIEFKNGQVVAKAQAGL